MIVEDVMVKSVACCNENNNLAEVAAIMWNERCGSLPVVDESGKVITMITDRDVCIALGTRNARASDVQAKDVSLPRVFTCSPDDDVLHALNTMVSQNVRRLPVVDANGKVVGILSIDDLLLHSTEWPDKSVVSTKEVVSAAKSILWGRARGSEHVAAELVGAHA